jgi:hypothetical protein
MSQPTTLLQLMIPHVCTGESHPVLQRLSTETFIGDDNPPFNDEIDFLFNFKFFKSLFFMVVNFKLDVLMILNL